MHRLRSGVCRGDPSLWTVLGGKWGVVVNGRFQPAGEPTKNAENDVVEEAQAGVQEAKVLRFLGVDVSAVQPEKRQVDDRVLEEVAHDAASARHHRSGSASSCA